MSGDTRPAVGREQGLVARLGRGAIRGWGSITAVTRPDPDFLVIGAKRGGSTSFYYDLLTHPQVTPLFPRPDHLPKATATKGIHYFDLNHDRGARWYRSHLPSRRVRAGEAARAGGPVVTGEASPYYLFHPAAPERAARLLPGIKLIAVLRNPVDRAHSHWKERRRAGAEPLKFADAVAAESERLAGLDPRRLFDDGFYSYAHEQQTYVAQGEYDDAIERWLKVFDRDRLLVIGSERYFADPRAVMDQASNFLGLGPHPGADLGAARNAASGADMTAHLRAQLTGHFAPHNARLESITGQQFYWR